MRFAWSGMLVVRSAMHRMLVPILHSLSMHCGTSDSGLGGPVP